MILEVAIVELNHFDDGISPVIKQQFQKDIIPHDNELETMNDGRPIVLAKNSRLYITALNKDIITSYLCGIADAYHLISIGFFPSGKNPVIHLEN